MVVEPNELHEPRGSVARAAVILRCLVSSPNPLRVSELAELSGLAYTTVHRALGSLRAEGLVEQGGPNGGYLLGPLAALLGQAHAKQISSALDAHVGPHLQILRDESKETASLAVQVGRRWMYSRHVESMQEIRRTPELGRTHPLHAGASGRAFLSCLSKEEAEVFLEGPLEKETGRTMVDHDQLLEEIERVRKHGYALGFEETVSGASGIAAPVRASQGDAVGVLVISGPSMRLTSERLLALAPLLQRRVAILEQQLSGASDSAH